MLLKRCESLMDSPLKEVVEQLTASLWENFAGSKTFFGNFNEQRIKAVLELILN